MKTLVKKVSIFLVLLLALISALFLTWKFQPKKKLNVYILDKTVVRPDRPEHKALVWLLNQNRYVNPDGKPYSASRDYWGFFPVDLENEIFDFRTVRINEVDTYAATYDAAYYTDCYGVYSFEWYKNITQPIHSSKVYGGLNQNDYLLLKRMQEGGKLIIGEYNMLSTPTNALIRSKAEQLFNLAWTGWSGRVFYTLNPEQANGPAEWMPKLYEAQHLKPWPRQGKGVVLISNDGLIDVLELEESLQTLTPIIEATPSGQEQLGLPRETPYPCWFEFTAPGASAAVHATFTLNVTEKGAEQLSKLGLPEKFPAIIQASEGNPTYYFAADFAENPVATYTAKIAYGKLWNRLLTPKNEKTAFFNTFYTPLMESILDGYHRDMAAKKQELSTH